MTDAHMAAVTAGRSDQVDVGATPTALTEPSGVEAQARAYEQLGASPLVSIPRIEERDRRLRAEYAELQVRNNIALARRDYASIQAIRTRAAEISDELRNLDGMRDIVRFNAGDITPLADRMYDISGNTLQLEQRPDGTFNLYQNGRLSSQGLTASQITTAGRALFDSAFQAQMQQARETDVRRANMIMEESIKQDARASAEMRIERAKVEAARRNPQIEVTSTRDAANNAVIVYSDRRTGVVLGGARFVQRVPPNSPRGTQPVLVLEPIPVGGL